ncbi:MAG: TldD/PmbA family protein [Spirochaetes bacterium]|nr:TldD/PmbA family protein [Spirochaetota bacterium]NLJ04532.1 TldD/PmbA family protein [Exilispira sp.]MBP8991136.1 TldD/PmbA family protein [Spirochaetota bacterium]HNV43247.1 metallopeptidase TldD-related protein [Exilispira sp.]HOV46630.1 metallopeptidase TldD-related protein [Exilispira sp.]
MVDQIAKKVFELSKAEQTEIFFYDGVEALTRFGQNQITQNVESQSQKMSIRMLDKQKTASMEISNFSDKTIKNAVDKLYQILQHQVQDERLQPLPEDLNFKANDTIPESFKKLDENIRAEYVKKALYILNKQSVSGAGICSQSKYNVTHMTSKNYSHTFYDWKFAFSLSAKNEYGITREEFQGTTLDNFNIDKLANKCIDSLNFSKEKDRIEANKYDIIFTPEAFAELIQYLFYFSFSAKEFYEKTSFMAFKKGQQVFSPLLTILNNPHATDSSALYYDFEGSPTKVVKLVDKGYCNNLISNRYFSKLLNIENTGNGLSPTTFDCFPINPEIEGGSRSLEQIIQSSDNALLINRLHYLNIIDPITLTVTGMTRDGVYKIEKGKITTSTNNLRFTESILTALSNIEELSSDRQQCEWFIGFMKVPAVKIKQFNFSSATDF